MSVTLPIVNVSVALNGLIDYAKERANKLVLIAEIPTNGVNPASVEKAEQCLEMLREADKELADFAQMNGFSLT